MTKTTLLITALTFVTTLSFGQIKTPINFDDCKMASETFVVAESSPTWKSDSITMKEFFQFVIKNSDTMKKRSGKVVMAILIDIDGSTCLNSFSDYDGAGFEAASFQKAVKEMPRWNPAIQSGSPVKFNKTIFLNIKKGQIQ